MPPRRASEKSDFVKLNDRISRPGSTFPATPQPQLKLSVGFARGSEGTRNPSETYRPLIYSVHSEHNLQPKAAIPVPDGSRDAAGQRDRATEALEEAATIGHPAD